ncbi:MAG: hypothetical protein HY509_01365, partial [Acidobacteria bacterium]|nr:hypothetical protein [Acidobacteriota bacterium]
VAPGGATSLLVGAPLLLWRHHRAPVLLVLAFHIFGYALLDRLVRQTLGGRERVLFALLYWLNPWRIYLSGFLWNPNYLPCFAAVHAWTAFRQRHSPGFWFSLVHVLATGIAFQVHASAALLAAVSAVLFLRGYLKVHWPGALGGGLIWILTLLPWFLRVWNDPSLLPVSKGFPGRGLVLVYPLARGLEYWLRLSSLFLSRQIVRFDFRHCLGGTANAVLAPAALILTRFLLPLTVAFPLLANLRLWRRGTRSRSFGRFPPEGSDRRWLQGYVGATFLAAVAVFALAPTTLMWWQATVLLHAAVLATVMWAGALLRTRYRRLARAAAWAHAAVGLLVILGVRFGNPQFRCSDRPELRGQRLRYDHPMFRELHIRGGCYSFGDPAGGWPDVLPTPAREEGR